MRNCIFKVTFDIYIFFLAGDYPAYRSNLQQHALKIKEIVTTKNSLAMTGENAVQVTHREFMSQLGQAALAGLFGDGKGRLECHEDLTDHEFLHLSDAVYDPIFANREWSQFLSPAGVLED